MPTSKYIVLQGIYLAGFINSAAYLAAAFLAPVSRRVVNALTGLLPFTARANLITKWLRLAPVRR